MYSFRLCPSASLGRVTRKGAPSWSENLLYALAPAVCPSTLTQDHLTMSVGGHPSRDFRSIGSLRQPPMEHELGEGEQTDERGGQRAVGRRAGGQRTTGATNRRKTNGRAAS